MDNKEENKNPNTGEEQNPEQTDQENKDPLSSPFSGGDERYRSRGTNKNIIPGASALNTVTKGANKLNNSVGKLNTRVQGKNPDGKFAKGMNKTSSSLNKGTNSLNAFNNRMQNINNAANRMGQVAEDPKGAAKDMISETAKEAVKKKVKLAFMALPVPVKIAIIGILAGFMLLLVLVCVVNIPDDDEEDFASGDYTYTVDNTSYWWPIGSAETTGSGSVKMATGDPGYSRISSGYGLRTPPGGVGSTNHQGIDIAGGWADGSKYAIASVDGTVYEVGDYCHGSNYRRIKRSGCGTARGNNVKVKNSDGNITIYQHLYSVNVKVGDKVKQGQVLGTIGSSGSVTGNHLHFEVWVNGVPVNPTSYVNVSSPRPMSTSAKTVSSKKVTIPSDATNIQKVCLVLKANGYSNEAVAGIIGNMQAESGIKIDPKAVNQIKCVGIVQWCDIPPTTYRKTKLMNTYGSSWSNLENQVNFVVQELNNMPSVKNYLMENHTPEEHADKFCYKYEIPGDSVCRASTRRNNARSVYDYVKNGCK